MIRLILDGALGPVAALVLAATPALAAPPASAQACQMRFAVMVTQGVGTIVPGNLLEGVATYALTGRSFRQDGGSTAHLADGRMTLHLGGHGGPGAAPGNVTGAVWALATTSQGAVADMVGIYARDVQGLSFGGVDYEGPMMITLYGPPGSQPGTAPPTTQSGWDAMTLRRSFAVHAQGYDRLAGDVTALEVTCAAAAPASVDNPPQQAYPAPQ